MAVSCDWRVGLLVIVLCFGVVAPADGRRHEDTSQLRFTVAPSRPLSASFGDGFTVCSAIADGYESSKKGSVGCTVCELILRKTKKSLTMNQRRMKILRKECHHKSSLQLADAKDKQEREYNREDLPLPRSSAAIPCEVTFSSTLVLLHNTVDMYCDASKASPSTTECCKFIKRILSNGRDVKVARSLASGGQPDEICRVNGYCKDSVQSNAAALEAQRKSVERAAAAKKAAEDKKKEAEVPVSPALPPPPPSPLGGLSLRQILKNGRQI